MSFTLPWTINAFVSTAINAANSITTAVYQPVSLLVNGNTELKSDTIINHLGIKKIPNSAYSLDISGNVNISGTISGGGAHTWTGKQTFTGGIDASATQVINFGSNAPTMSAANIQSGTVGQTQISNGYVDLSSAQSSISGAKTFVDVTTTGYFLPYFTLSNTSLRMGLNAMKYQAATSTNNICIGLNAAAGTAITTPPNNNSFQKTIVIGNGAYESPTYGTYGVASTDSVILGTNSCRGANLGNSYNVIIGSESCSSGNAGANLRSVVIGYGIGRTRGYYQDAVIIGANTLINTAANSAAVVGSGNFSASPLVYANGAFVFGINNLVNCSNFNSVIAIGDTVFTNMNSSVTSIGIGRYCGESLSSGYFNIFMGQSLTCQGATTNSTSIGHNSAVGSGDSNTFLIGGNDAGLQGLGYTRYQDLLIRNKNRILCCSFYTTATVTLTFELPEHILISTATTTTINLPTPATTAAGSLNLGARFKLMRIYSGSWVNITINAPFAQTILFNNTSSSTYTWSSTESYLELVCVNQTGGTWAVTSSQKVFTGTLGQSQITNGYVDLSSTQSSIAGTKTFTGSQILTGGLTATATQSISFGTNSPTMDGSNITGIPTTAIPGISNYLLSSTAASTYQTLSGMSSYLTTSAASSTYQTLSGMSSYLTIVDASSTYQTLSGMSSYLTTSSASSTYQTLSGMSSYLTTSAASSTYQTLSGMSSYLTTATAASTYQTLSGMSSYLTTATAASTYQPISSMSNYLNLTTDQTITSGIKKFSTAPSTGFQSLTGTGTVTFSLTGGKDVFLSNSGITGVTLPTPTTASLGQVFTIIRNGIAATSSYSIAPQVGTDRIIVDGQVLATYQTAFSQSSVTVTAIATTGSCWILSNYNNVNGLLLSKYVYPLSWGGTFPSNSNYSAINLISIGSGCLNSQTTASYYNNAGSVFIGANVCNLMTGNPTGCTIVGNNSYSTTTTGVINNTTSIGGDSGKLYAQTGTANTLLGYGTDFTAASSFSNSTAVGTGALISGSNQVVLGRTSETVIIPSAEIQYGGSYQPNSVYQTINATSLNWSTSPPTSLPQFILFSCSSTTIVTLTLPAISNANIYEGMEFQFRRTNTFASATTTSQLQVTCSGTDTIYISGGMTTAASILQLASGAFYSRLVCINKTTTPYNWAYFP